MNIMLTHASFEVFGGAERVVAKLAEYLVSKFHRVMIVTYRCPEDIYVDLVGCEVTTGSYNKLKEFVHEHYKEYDVINSHNHPMELLLWPKKKPHVWSYNEAPYYVQMGEHLSPVEKDIIESSVTTTVLANKKNERMYKELYNTSTITNMYGIDSEFYSKVVTPDRVKYGLNNTDFVISVNGWVHPNKRQRDALKAFIEVKKNIPNAKLVLAGTQEPNETAFLTQMANDNKIGRDVIFTGHIKNEQVRDIYYASDVILCPFQQQGSYLTILESLCTKKPVIVSPDTMLSEDLTENKVGIVTPDYVQAIMDVYTGSIKPDYDNWHKWASQFTWERYCSNMLNIFKVLCQQSA